MEEKPHEEKQKKIIEALKNPRGRREALLKYDSGDLINARIRDVYQRRKDRILKEMTKNDTNKVGSVG